MTLTSKQLQTAQVFSQAFRFQVDPRGEPKVTISGIDADLHIERNTISDDEILIIICAQNNQTHRVEALASALSFAPDGVSLVDTFVPTAMPKYDSRLQVTMYIPRLCELNIHSVHGKITIGDVDASLDLSVADYKTAKIGQLRSLKLNAGNGSEIYVDYVSLSLRAHLAEEAALTLKDFIVSSAYITVGNMASANIQKGYAKEVELISYRGEILFLANSQRAYVYSQNDYGITINGKGGCKITKRLDSGKVKVEGSIF